jgi:hypothetical protein
MTCSTSSRLSKSDCRCRRAQYVWREATAILPSVPISSPRRAEDGRTTVMRVSKRFQKRLNGLRGQPFGRWGSRRANRSLRCGKRDFQGRDKEAETAQEIQGRRCRDKISLGYSANSGRIAGFREISVRTRMRGGGRSHRRTCLREKDSLVSGKNTGKIGGVTNPASVGGAVHGAKIKHF